MDEDINIENVNEASNPIIKSSEEKKKKKTKNKNKNKNVKTIIEIGNLPKTGTNEDDLFDGEAKFIDEIETVKKVNGECILPMAKTTTLMGNQISQLQSKSKETPGSSKLPGLVENNSAIANEDFSTLHDKQEVVSNETLNVIIESLKKMMTEESLNEHGKLFKNDPIIESSEEKKKRKKKNKNVKTINELGNLPKNGTNLDDLYDGEAHFIDEEETVKEFNSHFIDKPIESDAINIENVNETLNVIIESLKKTMTEKSLNEYGKLFKTDPIIDSSEEKKKKKEKRKTIKELGKLPKNGTNEDDLYDGEADFMSL